MPYEKDKKSTTVHIHLKYISCVGLTLFAMKYNRSKALEMWKSSSWIKDQSATLLVQTLATISPRVLHNLSPCNIEQAVSLYSRMESDLRRNATAPNPPMFLHAPTTVLCSRQWWGSQITYAITERWMAENRGASRHLRGCQCTTERKTAWPLERGDEQPNSGL